jgi:hypothetical protein
MRENGSNPNPDGLERELLVPRGPAGPASAEDTHLRPASRLR